MTEEEFVKLFNTMGFNNGIVKESRLINGYSIYLIMFDGPDLIFEYHNMSDWSVQTAKNYVTSKNYVRKEEENGTNGNT